MPFVFAFILALLSLPALAAAPVLPASASIPSRTTCTAPCSVFFDASATTDADESDPFHHLLFTWNFGNPSAGAWTYGANTSGSRNFAAGAVAAHVYEFAGSYTWTVRACDATSCDTESGTITVTAADTTFSTTNTMCIANGSLPVAGSGGCPSGAAVRNSGDLDASITACVTGNTKRCLFKGGDTFTSSTPVTITNNQLLFGAYGTGKPNMVVSATYIFNISGAGSPTMNDIVIMDWSVDCGNTSGSAPFTASGSFSQFTQLRVATANCGYSTLMDTTVLSALNSTASTTMRVAGVSTNTVLAVNSIAGVSNGQTISIALDAGNKIRHVTTVSSTNGTGPTITIGSGLPGPAAIGNQIRVWTPTDPPTHPLWDKVFVVANTADGLDGSADGSGMNAVFAAGKRIAFLGNYYNNRGEGEHGIRTMFTQKGVYSHNTMEAVNRSAMTLRSSDYLGEPWLPASTYSGTAVVSNNQINAGGFVGIESNNQDGTGRQKDWLVERNFATVYGGANSNYMGFYDGNSVTFRNNIIDLSANTYVSGAVGFIVGIGSAHTETPSKGWIYNNTIYRSTDTGGAINSRPILLNTSTTSMVARNNLCYTPSVAADARAFCVTDSSTGGTVSNNTAGEPASNGAKDSPAFVGALTAPSGFQIGSSSYGASGGAAQFPAQQFDFFGCRDKSAANRIGAIVQRGQAQCSGAVGP
jgi:hypothetical protein